ncbi:hypothetical protein LTR96_007168 [Exophiala xenobiotica]|nr:hypothetical protein LTR92_007715 [Exophiala xenobiotica]KAK5220472.1 hypothetical protein LTR72_007094 [Exophiala xenobiotica]KAK5267840.1 hypothetical protein LTR96_007168 [Exophiala xenobiotica]KAK5290745.1 hypothetical protein LTR14_006252 [Exophiala xenobiotica]KAK5336201.1 hypothetical protein LTR98_007531 [Exophiala xenobiotica]
MAMATSAAIAILLGAGTIYLSWDYLFAKSDSQDETSSLDDNDHPLLKDHSENRSYETEYARYPSIRIFYYPHAHAEKLQAIADLPLLVFIHGLGGSLPQFAPLLGSLANVGPCFGIELPGHGLSAFSPKDYNAYKFQAFVALWRKAIEDICREKGHQKVVFVAHSLGCSIAATLATDAHFSVPVEGIVGLCPKAFPPEPPQVTMARRFLSLPDTVLNIVRFLDRRGGVNSKSVERMAGKGAKIDLRRLQLAFNSSFKTAVWKRATLGCLPTTYDESGHPVGGLPGKQVWSKIKVPLFLIAGEADTVTKPVEVQHIVSYLSKPELSEARTNDASTTTSKAIPVADDPTTNKKDSSAVDDETDTSPPHPQPTSDAADQEPRAAAASDQKFGTIPSTSEMSSHNSRIVKTAILPAPAAHALMYDHSTYRTVAGLIEDFLSRYVSSQLSLGWQLQQLTTSGKWDVKNLEKWRRVLPVSGPIGAGPGRPHGLFRALKTLREQDPVHTPAVFLREWRDRIFAVIDISHDSPVYDTKALERGGIEYHKFPTVSKVPPTPLEVKDFIALVDRLRGDRDRPSGGQEHGHEHGHGHGHEQGDKRAIGVHCHYGYNRTGFFIACYLIEREGYRPQDALDEFARAKPPGIRHDHFIDTLFMRYHVGLRRASTIK